MTEDFEYSTNADSTISIGLSGTATNGFTSSGTLTITNSIGTNSGFTVGQGTLRYVQSHMYYQEYQDNGAAACPPNGPYKVQADHDAGDSFLESFASVPARNPYGDCSDDPYGLATVQKGGHFQSDRGRAETITSAQQWLGFTFSSTSGFSNDLYDNYLNQTSGNQSVCGTTYMPNVQTVYNNTW